MAKDLGVLLCLGLFLQFSSIPTPRSYDVSDHRLSAGVNVNMLDRDLLGRALRMIDRFRHARRWLRLRLGRSRRQHRPRYRRSRARSTCNQGRHFRSHLSHGRCHHSGPTTSFTSPRMERVNAASSLRLAIASAL